MIQLNGWSFFANSGVLRPIIFVCYEVSDLSITFQCRLKIVYCSGSEIQTGDTEGIQAFEGK